MTESAVLTEDGAAVDVGDAPSASEVWSRANAASDLPPGQLLTQAKRLMDQAQKLVDQAVIAERARGTSWETVGEVLGGVTKSAAQKRYGVRYREWADQNEEIVYESGDGLGTPKPQFPLAYGQLWEEWGTAAKIIDAQDWIVELSNATAAASGATNLADEPPRTGAFDRLKELRGNKVQANMAALEAGRRFGFRCSCRAERPFEIPSGNLLYVVDLCQGDGARLQTSGHAAPFNMDAEHEGVSRQSRAADDTASAVAQVRRKHEAEPVPSLSQETASLESRVAALESAMARLLVERTEGKAPSKDAQPAVDKDAQPAINIQYLESVLTALRKL
ncbi:hypothetical protein ABZ235_11785 [Streptomyces canus]|uniref:hypothetical protein n=1 Tax=Streptomyces canus TaxID=58343 RepID=UPI0033B96BAB